MRALINKSKLSMTPRTICLGVFKVWKENTYDELTEIY